MSVIGNQFFFRDFLWEDCSLNLCSQAAVDKVTWKLLEIIKYHCPLQVIGHLSGITAENTIQILTSGVWYGLQRLSTSTTIHFTWHGIVKYFWNFIWSDVFDFFQHYIPIAALITEMMGDGIPSKTSYLYQVY